MRILIDRVYSDLDGSHIGDIVFHTEWNDTFVHPEFPDKQLTRMDLISLWENRPDLREKAGWHKASQHHDETDVSTPWERLQKHLTKEKSK